MTCAVNKVNWPDSFPEKPEVTVEVSNDHEALYLKWHVKGEQLRAVTTEDQGPVWEDSWVEFFCRVPGEDTYCNFECNCIGAMVGSRRKGIEEKDGWFEWEVEERIPLDLIFQSPISNLQFPLTLKANFYKCADKTKRPHFLSWQPICLPKPDFHCPQFFGEITLL